jgi:hypothetical protein
MNSVFVIYMNDVYIIKMCKLNDNMHMQNWVLYKMHVIIEFASIMSRMCK